MRPNKTTSFRRLKQLKLVLSANIWIHVKLDCPPCQADRVYDEQPQPQHRGPGVLPGVQPGLSADTGELPRALGLQSVLFRDSNKDPSEGS